MQNRTATVCLSNRALAGAAGLVCLLGATILVGWHSANPLLIQVHPVFAVARYLSGFGLLGIGITTFFLIAGWRHLVLAGAAIVASLGLISLGEAGGMPLAFSAAISPAPPPGYPASSLIRSDGATAVCFLIAGLAFVWLCKRTYTARDPLIVGLLSTPLVVLSILATFGYTTGSTASFGTQHFARMSLHETMGFAITGVGFFCFLFRRGRETKVQVLRWLPLSISAGFMTATLVVWQAVSVQDRNRIERMVQFETSRAKAELEGSTPNRLDWIRDAGSRWSAGEEKPIRDLKEEVNRYMLGQPGCLAVGRVDKDFTIHWIETLRVSENLSEVYFGNQARGVATLQELSSKSGLTVQTVSPTAQASDRYLLAHAPIYRNGRAESAVIAVYRIDRLLETILNVNVAPGYAITVFSGERQIYSRHAADREYQRKWGRSHRLSLFDQGWELRVWPAAEAMAKDQFSIGNLALVGGLLMTSLLAVAVHLAQTARGRARELEFEVHERRHVEGALRSSEAKYRSLIENLEQSVFLKDCDLRYVAANKHYCESLGIKEADIIGRTDTEIYPSELAAKYAAESRQVLSEGKRLEIEDQCVVAGKPKTVRIIKTPVRDDRGKTVGVLGILWDVSEQRGLEDQLRQAQKMDAIGQLAGGVAHDFNNLLTAILGNISLIQMSVAEDDPNAELLESAEKAAVRAANLTGQLLGFSRQSPIRSQAINLNTIVDEAKLILSRTIDPRVRLETAKEDELWMIQADAGQMNQVLVNLCINARDAMPDGGRLTIETSNVELDEEFARYHLESRPGEFVRLRVSDSGQGMTPEVRARIFEPFFTTKGPGKGTGLGLAMVFGIVKQHSGWIDCYSEVGEGTRFDIYLPRTKVSADTAVMPRRRKTPSRGNETILLADDEPMILNLAKTILERQGYTIILAEDGLQAVEIYERELGRIDLVILDLTMPEMSGRDAFRKLMEMDPNVRVLFASGYSAEYVTNDEQDLILGFVSKPYRPEDLVQTVRSALDRAKSGSSRVDMAICRV